MMRSIGAGSHAWAALLLLSLLAPSCGGGGKGGGGVLAPSDIPPSGTITTPSTPQSGVILISYTLVDPASDTSVVSVEFSINGGGSFAPASMGVGGDGDASLAASPSPGTAHTFAWNSVMDGVGVASANPAVQIRITPGDGMTGPPITSGSFTVNNVGNTPPTATIQFPLAGTTQSGTVGIQYGLADAQSDRCNIIAEFSTN